MLCKFGFNLGMSYMTLKITKVKLPFTLDLKNIRFDIETLL